MVYLLFSAFIALPFFIIFALAYIGLAFIPQIERRLHRIVHALIISIVFNLPIIFFCGFDLLHEPLASLLEYSASFLGKVAAWLPFAIFTGMIAVIPNLKRLIEGDDATARKPRIIVYLALLGGFALGMLCDVSGVTDYVVNRTLTGLIAELLLGDGIGGVAKAMILLLPWICAIAVWCLIAYLMIRVVLHIMKKNVDLVIPYALAAAIVIVVLGGVINAASPYVYIPDEYKQYVEEDEIAELRATLPRYGLSFQYKIEIEDANEDRVIAYFSYIGQSHRTKCVLYRTEDGFDPVLERED